MEFRIQIVLITTLPWLLALPTYAQELKDIQHTHLAPGQRKTSQRANSCPPPKSVPRANGEPAVWGDFEKATYEMTYDLRKREVRVKTTLKLKTEEQGYPIFDLVELPLKITIDGKEVGHLPQKLPGKESTVRRLSEVVKPGAHTIEIWSRMESDVNFIGDNKHGNPPLSIGAEAIENRFRFFDMRDRSFLEKYLPTNLEFDQYAMEMKVKIIGGKKEHEVFTNGKKTKTRDGFEIQFPEHFSSSSPFFHIAPKGRHSKVEFNYTSIDGRNIPITIFTQRGKLGVPWLASHFKNRLAGVEGRSGTKPTEGILAYVERRFGPWPHDAFVVYGINKLRGGMEFPGAAETSHLALEHEVFHNYFGRSIMPCDGETGWLDEAFASWNDHKSIHSYMVKFGWVDHRKEGILHSGIAYKRATAKGSYLQGRHFVTEVNRRLANSPRGPKSFDQFLRYFHAKRKLSQVNAEIFFNDLEEFSGLDARPIAAEYIYLKDK